MNFWIEVNTARKNAEPVWRPLLDNSYQTCVWDTEAEARVVLVEEDRGPNARIMTARNSRSVVIS